MSYLLTPSVPLVSLRNDITWKYIRKVLKIIQHVKSLIRNVAWYVFTYEIVITEFITEYFGITV